MDNDKMLETELELEDGEQRQDAGDGTGQDCAKELNKLGPHAGAGTGVGTGAGGWRTMTRCWSQNWSRMMENSDKMLETELDKTVLRNSTN